MCKYLQTGMIGIMVLAVAASAHASRPGNISFENRVRFAYDDNIKSAEEDTESSFRITVEPTVSGSIRLDNAFLSLRYRTDFNWYEDRDDDTDLNHTIDLIWNQTVSRRISFGITDTFRIVDRPELMHDDGTIDRPDSSYMYNTILGTLTTVLTPNTRLDFSVRHAITRYDEDRLAERDDYDLIAGGATLRGRIAKDTSAFIDLRAETIDYINAGTVQPENILFPGAERVLEREVPDRGSDTFSGGIGLDRVFGPDLVGVFRVGVSYKDFKAANIDSTTDPYADASVTYSISPSTRATLGLSYQVFQPGLITFANQVRTAADLRVAHDLSSRLQLTVTGGVVQSKYDADESVEKVPLGAVDRDGKENALSAGVRLSYQATRNQWVEAGWSYRDLDSDIRRASEDLGGRIGSSYTRNIFDVAWRVRL